MNKGRDAEYRIRVRGVIPEVPGVLRETRGGALLLVVLVLAVLLSLAASLMSLTGTESITGVQQLNQIQAHYIAEAGVEKALAALKLDTRWRQGFTKLAYAGGCMDKVTVTVSQGESDDNIYVLVIKSTGSYSGARRTVEVKVRVSPVPTFYPLSDGDLDVMRDAARGNGSGHYYAGDHTFTATGLQNMAGIYFVEGRATVAGQYSGRATIVSPGDIYLPGPLFAVAGSTNKLGLIAGGSVYAAEEAHLVEAVVYASSYVVRGAFTEHRGSIMAPVMELSGSFKLEAPGPGLPPAIPAEIKVLYWKELYPMF